MKYTKKLGKLKGQKLSKTEKLKSEKLFKSGKLKSKKMFKSQNLAKSGKKLSKNENLPIFRVIKARLKFLTPNIKTTFNCLWLAFTKALIL